MSVPDKCRPRPRLSPGPRHPYEEVRDDLHAGDQKKPEFLALNPNGKVPLLVIDGTPVFESVAIQIALGERHGVAKGLWPALDSAEHHPRHQAVDARVKRNPSVSSDAEISTSSA